ncbi:hypothetical protein [Enhygromyxa salina]|uniref:hypothetical protein n=1 Tax=Enhygromyxa salina TaxID=215803 RepID=UPI0011BAB221|nr:hypothetical protein [Enhygromyxa salina]
MDKILCLFIIGKIVSIDEAIMVFAKEAGKTPAHRTTLRATKPLLTRARRSLGAIKVMRSRWLAHGWSKQRGKRDSPLLARLESGAPESVEELRFIAILYLQYVCTFIVAIPGLLLEAHEYMKQTSRETAPFEESIPSDFEAEARQLVHQVCAELDIEDLPVMIYDPGAL